MHLAATQWSLRGLSLLLSNGASINASDDRGRTPLHAACATCRGNSSTGDSHLASECIELLLSSGALEDARDGKGQTALHLAVLAGNLSAARALLTAGATPVADDEGNSPLHLAAAQGHSDIIQLLVGGDRERSSRGPPASSDVVGRTLGRTTAVIGGLRPASDVDYAAHGGGQGNVATRHRESTSTATDGEVFGDDGLAVRAVISQAQHPGTAARDNHPTVFGNNAEEASFGRGSHSRYDGRQASAAIDGSPAYEENSHGRSETSSLKLVSNDQDDHLCREVIRGKPQHRWPETTDAHNCLLAKNARNASKTIEEGDGSRYGGHQALDPEQGRLSEGKEGKRNSSRQSRRRHASDRDDRTLYWPEALSAHEYAQVNSTDRQLTLVEACV